MGDVLYSLILLVVLVIIAAAWIVHAIRGDHDYDGIDRPRNDDSPGR
jgi:hypothetical protein